jgi:hypothetical protein
MSSPALGALTITGQATLARMAKAPGVHTQWQPLPRPMAEVEWMPSVIALVGCECRKRLEEIP